MYILYSLSFFFKFKSKFAEVNYKFMKFNL